MYQDGIGNEFEHAHQKGLTRGFDLGWSYKGRFDRQLINDHLDMLDTQYNKLADNDDKQHILSQKSVLHDVLKAMKDHQNNREFIT